MCFFLTIAVPSLHAERIGEEFGRGFQVHPTANPSAMDAFPSGFVARLITSGMCSCDLYVRPQDAHLPNSPTHGRLKYEKRGWSESKIKRALSQAEANAAKPKQRNPGVHSDVVNRLQAICRVAGSVAMFVHFYNSEIETERLSLRPSNPCKCDQLSARAKELGEDQVLIVKA
jgi:hypothetical protein